MQAQSALLPDRTQRNARARECAGARNNSNQDRQMNSMTLEALPSALRITEGRMTLAPADAAVILDTMNYPRQRRAYSHHVALLADLMRRAQWTPGSQIAFGRLRGELFLVNGQHRLRALMAAGILQTFQVLILGCQTDAELAALYHRFDVAQRGRSVAEILNAADVAVIHGLSKSMTRVVYEAAGYILSGFNRPNYQVDPVGVRSVDARMEAAEDWWPVAKVYEPIVVAAPEGVRKKLRLPGIASVAFVTLKHQPAKAREFWLGIAKDDGLRIGDPRKTLLKAFASRDLRSDGTNMRAAIPAHAWNAWFRGDQLQVITSFNPTAKRILGTPFVIGGAAKK